MNKLKVTAGAIYILLAWACNAPVKNAAPEEPLSFDRQMEIFRELGYRLNKGITGDAVFNYARSMVAKNADIEAEFAGSPFSLLYYCLGWGCAYPPRYCTDDCIWYDVEYIDSCDKYVSFMQRMGAITHGDLTFTDISLRIDGNNCEWIDFKVNGAGRSWKLEKVGYIADSFFSRFASLPAEFKTAGRYTYYDNGGQQFVIDYATDAEQQQFIKATGLQREWLRPGKHFSLIEN